MSGHKCTHVGSISGCFDIQISAIKLILANGTARMNPHAYMAHAPRSKKGLNHVEYAEREAGEHLCKAMRAVFGSIFVELAELPSAKLIRSKSTLIRDEWGKLKIQTVCVRVTTVVHCHSAV